MNKIFKFLLSLVILFLLLSGGYFFLEKEIKRPYKFQDEEKIFGVKEGERTSEIAKNLEKEGLIKKDFYFLFYVWKTGKGRKIKAGKYCLSPNQNIPELVDTMEKGPVREEVKITFPEGWKISDIEERLKSFGLVEGKEISSFKIKDFKAKYDFLEDAPSELNLEGYLFPDTYFFNCPLPEIICKNGKGEIISCKKGDPKKIVRKFLENFGKELTSDLRGEIKRQNKSIFEIVTMASLLEKEVRIKEDKEIISGILWKRFKNDIPLQVDATITYLTGKKTIKITKEELQIDSLYNTYKYKGLPIGPICNPSFESIKTAVFPKNSDFWYYLSTPEGKTIFSKTLKEHNLAKAKYLPR